MKSIETILDECIDQIRAGKSVEDVLKKFPDSADELRSLLGISQNLEALPDPSPSVEGVMLAMSQQINQEPVAPQGRKPARVTLFARPVLLRLAASIAVILLLSWGTAVASSDAVPGNFMYPVKRFSEKVRLLFTINDKNEAELRITFSERRLSEALKTYQQGGGIDDGLLRQMLDEAKQALDQTLALSPEERGYLISRVGYLTAHQNNVIEAVKRTASPEEQDDLKPASEMCGKRVQWMGEMMKAERMIPPTCSGCWGAIQEAPQNDANENLESPKTMEQWMDCCPM
jgi:hypothetical protein